MSKISDGLEMPEWKYGFYRSKRGEEISWGLFLPLGEPVEVPYEEYDGLADIELTEPSIDPAAFWSTLQEHAPEVAKALADTAPRAGVTAVYPLRVERVGDMPTNVLSGPVFANASISDWERELCAQLDKTKEYHMHITLVEAE